MYIRICICICLTVDLAMFSALSVLYFVRMSTELYVFILPKIFVDKDDDDDGSSGIALLLLLFTHFEHLRMVHNTHTLALSGSKSA